MTDILLSYVYAVWRKRPVCQNKYGNNAQNYNQRKGNETANKQRKKTCVVDVRRVFISFIASVFFTIIVTIGT